MDQYEHLLKAFNIVLKVGIWGLNDKALWANNLGSCKTLVSSPTLQHHARQSTNVAAAVPSLSSASWLLVTWAGASVRYPECDSRGASADWNFNVNPTGGFGASTQDVFK